MDELPDPASELETLRREVQRLRGELAAAGRAALRRDEAEAAIQLHQAGRQAANDARTAVAEVEVHAAWARTAELGTSLARRVAESQARLIASQAAVASLEHANEGLVAGQAAIALREADLRTVIESAIDCAIVTTDRCGLVLAWNSGACRLLGWDAAGVRRMDLAAVLPPEAHGDGALAADIAATLSGLRSSREGWLLRRDGSQVWASIEATALRADGEEDAVGVLWMLRDRGEARRAEMALRESEAKYRSLFEAIDEGYLLAEVIVDADGKPVDVLFLEANPAAVRLAGRDFAQQRLRGIDPGYEDHWLEIYGRVALTGEAVHTERYAAPHGRWFEFRASRVGVPGDRRVAVVFQDTTERRRAEAALRESEVRHRLMIESWAQAVWDADAAGVVVADSPSWRAYTGQTTEESLGYGWLDAVHPDDRAYAERQWRETIAARGLVNAEFRLCTPHSGWRWTNVRAAPVPDAEGRIEKWVGMNIDIDARHRAEDALRESEERFRTLAEGIPELVWRSAAEGRWTWASPQWEAYTGLDDGRSRDAGWLDALHPDDWEGAQAAWEEADTLGHYQADFRLRHAGSGQYAWFQTRAMPFRDAEGTVEWIGACANIDEQIRARETLARTGEELEARVAERTGELMAAEESLRQSQKLEAIGQLTGGIAHDFNNMLQGVSGALAMAQRRLMEGRVPDVTRYMQAAGDAAARAAGLTRRLLAFARRQPLDPRPFDADVLIGGMGELLRRAMGPSITIVLDLRDGTGQVVCDPSELESAVLNLCINARDAMPQGGRLTIATEDLRLSAADLGHADDPPPGNFVSIRIEDTGTGMTPEILERVLEPFFTTKPRGEGTGLGLSQVHGFVRQSGGVLRITSAPGQGTTMRILLPLQLTRAPSVGTDRPAPAAIQQSRGETVLMVDDEESVRGPAAEHLRDLGYRVVEAKDGPTALRLLDEGLRPDVLVTDVGMPNGMDGRVVTEEAQRRLPALPVIFVTGYAHVALPEDAVVVTKPFDLDLLARRLGSVFARQP